MAFPKQQRIKDAKSITRVLRETRPWSQGGISLRATSGDNQTSRIVILVPQSASAKAVQRNTLRRRTSEALRSVLSQFQSVPKKDIVVTVRALPDDITTLRATLVLLLQKSGILQQ